MPLGKWLTAIHCIILTGSQALKDVQLSMPRFVRRGSNVRLTCSYDLESDALYAVKWYHNDKEFYRYLPKEVPPQKAFPLPSVGIEVDVS